MSSPKLFDRKHSIDRSGLLNPPRIDRHRNGAGLERLGKALLGMAQLLFSDGAFLHFLPLMDVTAPPAVAAWSERLLARPSAVNSAPDI